MKAVVLLAPLALAWWCGSSARGAESRAAAPAPFFRGDFETGDLSQWPELLDAQLLRDPPGIQVVRRPAFRSRYAAKVVTLNSPDSSIAGDASFVEANSYDLPWEKEGSVWHRFQVLLPSGKKKRFPGRFRVNSRWNMFVEWHNPPCSDCPDNYLSTYVGVSETSHLLLRMAGGLTTNPTLKTVRDRRRLRYDHWYDILVRFVYSDSPTEGRYEWWVDRKLVAVGRTPTLYRFPDGLTRGNRFSVGHYRGTVGYRDTIYVDGVVVGPTRASVSPSPGR